MIPTGLKLAEGKTKIIFAHQTDPTLVIIQHKDSVSAGDGARRNEIAGKAALAGRTTANVFRLLRAAGIATHFVDAPDSVTMVARRCAMIPVEVVARRIAAGSYVKRHPETAEGTRFDPLLVEYFLKDDARHDPRISPEDMVAQGVAKREECTAMGRVVQTVFAVLERAWAAQDVTLVDLKIEFGRDVAGKLLVADVIDNDSWRIWPGGDKTRQLDKQVYRDMKQVDEDGLAQVRRRYEIVAEMTEGWQQP